MRESRECLPTVAEATAAGSSDSFFDHGDGVLARRVDSYGDTRRLIALQLPGSLFL